MAATQERVTDQTVEQATRALNRVLGIAGFDMRLALVKCGNGWEMLWVVPADVDDTERAERAVRGGHGDGLLGGTGDLGAVRAVRAMTYLAQLFRAVVRDAGSS
jgi:hypothetical protein